MSRARGHTRLYLVDHRAVDRDHGAAHEHRDPLLALAQRLARSRAQHLAADHTPTPDDAQADGVSTDELRRRLLATMPRAVDRRRADIDERIRDARERITALHELLAAEQQRLAGLQRGTGRLTRRDQITHATATLQRHRGDLRAWQRHLDQLEDERADLDQADRHCDEWARAYADELTDYADRVRATRPQTRPDTPTQRQRWRHDLTDPPDPADHTRERDPDPDHNNPHQRHPPWRLTTPARTGLTHDLAPH